MPLNRELFRRSLFRGGLVACHCLDGRNDDYGGYNDKFFMLGRNGQAAHACEQKNSPKSSVLSLGLISKLSFCTSCVMVWLEDTSDDETE